MSNAFEDLVNNLKSGKLGHKHVQMAYRAWIRERDDFPGGIKDLLGGKGDDYSGLLYKLFYAISEATGSVFLAYNRGLVGGRHDAYLKIKNKYPEAAEYILKVYNMDSEGCVTL